MNNLRFLGFTGLFATAAMCLAVGSASAQTLPQGTETAFARVSEYPDGAPKSLDVAISTYQPRDGRFAVDLIGAVHVGDRSYYRQLNQLFQNYDAVLFEMIAPEGTDFDFSDVERRGLLTGAQIGLTRALGLSFQLDEIDYTAPNLVHADLSPAELRQSMLERGETLYVYFWRLFFASLSEAAKDPLGVKALADMSVLASGDADPVKIAFAYEMTNIDLVSNMLEGSGDGDGAGDGSAIIAARNQRAIDVLIEAIDDGAEQIGIFYGVAHMPDFEIRLREQLDADHVHTDWIAAWRLDTDPEGNVDDNP